MKVSQLGCYQGFSQAIYDGYQRHSQYLALTGGTRLAYDLLLPTKEGVPANEPLPTLFKYTPYLRAFTIFNAGGNFLLGDLYPLAWYQKAMLRLRYILSNQGHLMDAVFNTGWLKTLLYHGYAVVVVERPGTAHPLGSWTPLSKSGLNRRTKSWIGSLPRIGVTATSACLATRGRR